MRPALRAIANSSWQYLELHVEELCDEHRYKWSVNPLRILDCKRPECRKVSRRCARSFATGCVMTAASISPPCSDGLDRLSIAYEQDDYLVRGLDYYTRTTFEFGSAAVDGVGGGGRYDGLVSALGGPEVSGVGFGAGIERILLACDAEGVFSESDMRLSRGLDAFVVDTSESGAALLSCARASRCGPRRRPGIRRALDEGAAEGCRPLRGQGGVHRRRRRTRRRVRHGPGAPGSRAAQAGEGARDALPAHLFEITRSR